MFSESERFCIINFNKKKKNDNQQKKEKPTVTSFSPDSEGCGTTRPKDLVQS